MLELRLGAVERGLVGRGIDLVKLLAFVDVGAFVERTFGLWRFLAIYFASTVGGFYLSSQWSYYVPSVGSSAGVFGLIGSLIALGLIDRSAMGEQIKQQAIRWAMYGLLLGFLPFNMDNAAHIGGLFTGLIVTWVAGFWLFQTKSLEECIEWVKRCPNPMPTDSEIEIRQVFEAEDFGEQFTPELQERAE